ncbi:Subunit of the condensin complex, which reorganizes chromosomes during cell division [Rhizoctonia solani AG-1 IA]|uniref:Structural maintenance of chromosomes protein 4 n=1 Tax=Thanatephorus cucumeris (strain AG1-IA) TaxID=983506 RepID=L8WRN2_THACA|nr:Subunit of the condensin complex, which reorganizes chromosomes during cell division [Rhizoctonia solani AG-1 IA]
MIRGLVSTQPLRQVTRKPFYSSSIFVKGMATSGPAALQNEKGLHLLTMPTPNGRKVQTALEELKDVYQTPFSWTYIDISKNIQKEPWFLSLNPNGRIPTLVDNSQSKPFPVMESGAILLYLDQCPCPSLPRRPSWLLIIDYIQFGFADPLEHNEMLQWLFWMNAGLGPMQGQLNHFNKFAPEKIEYGIKRYHDETLRLLSVIDDHLSGKWTKEPEREYLAGNGKGKYSWTFDAVCRRVYIAEFSGITKDELASLKHLNAWLERITQRPAVQRALNNYAKPEAKRKTDDPLGMSVFGRLRMIYGHVGHAAKAEADKGGRIASTQINRRSYPNSTLRSGAVHALLAPTTTTHRSPLFSATMIPGLSLPRIFPTISCDESVPSSAVRAATSSALKLGSAPETEIKRWKRNFEAYAKDVNGGKYLDRDSFINAIAPKEDFSRIHRDQFGILFRVADSTRRGLVSWDEFVVFETMLKRPDADYWIAFQYFDVDSNGTITFDEFKSVFSSNLGPDSIPFNFDWVCKANVSVNHSSTWTRIKMALFDRINLNASSLSELAGHKLSDSVLERLPTLTTLTPGQKISYSEVIAFHNVIHHGRIDQTDFLNTASTTTRYGLFSPMEASIVFHFASRGAGGQPRLALVDFAQLLDPRWKTPSDASREKAATQGTRGVLDSMLRSAYSFTLGGIAGSFGATVVYPIDLGEWFCCCWALIVTDHAKSAFGSCRSDAIQEQLRLCCKGAPQRRVHRLLPWSRTAGVAPEKAIKLTVNDLVRGRATDPETGRIKLMWEVIAGGTAGGCQVASIIVLVQGEAAKLEGAVPRGAVHIVRQLGLLGLYKGATACLLRDIPFSAIYFPAYAHLKKDVFNEGYHGKKLTFGETLLAAGIAGGCRGMPAAYLATPADVIKTRLQVEARSGQSTYNGIGDAFRKILREEGASAFFKGGIARVVRSSPQFGFTLVAYEYLHKWIPYPGEKTPSEKIETALSTGHEDLSRIRARNALKILLDVHSDFERKEPATKARVYGICVVRKVWICVLGDEVARCLWASEMDSRRRRVRKRRTVYIQNVPVRDCRLSCILSLTLSSAAPTRTYSWSVARIHESEKSPVYCSGRTISTASALSVSFYTRYMSKTYCKFEDTKDSPNLEKRELQGRSRIKTPTQPHVAWNHVSTRFVAFTIPTMPPRRTTRVSTESKPVSKATSRGRKVSNKAEPVVVDSDSSDGAEEAAPPKPAPPKARRGRPAKTVVKEEPVETNGEEEEEEEVEVEKELKGKGKGKGKASAVVPAKRRSNRQTVGEHTDKENTAGETTPVEDAPKRNVRRTSRQPSIAKAPLSKQIARKASGGRRKRNQEEDEEENEDVERPNKRQTIKEESEPQSEAEAGPDASKIEEDAEEEGTPVSEQPPPEPDEDSDTPAPKNRAASSKTKKNTVANGKATTARVQSPGPSKTPPRSKSEVKTPSKPKPPARSAIPESESDDERDLLAEAAATPLKRKLGPRESLSMSASQIQQLSSQGELGVVSHLDYTNQKDTNHDIGCQLNQNFLKSQLSYAGRQEIGPFHKSFSAIVGPNGSGKSNTIDALLFVFGYRASKMRQGKLSELIHNSPGADAYEVVPNSRLIVSRTAYKNNKSDYTINAKPSNYSEVTTLLKSRGIDLDHKRFLILQGEVESIAQMKPKAPNEHEDGLLEYLEDIIGTSKYKEPIEEAMAEADRLAEERGEKMSRLKIVEKEKSKLEADKEEAEAFLRDQNDLVRAQSKLWQFNTYKCKQNIEATQANLKAELAKEVEANAGYIRETEELETQYKEQREAFDVLERELAKINKSLSAQSKVEVGLEEKQKHIKTKEKKLQKSIAEDAHRKNEAETWIVNHTEQLEKSTKELARLEKELVVEEEQLEIIAESVKGKDIQAKQAELIPWQRKIAGREGDLNVATREREMLESKAKNGEQAIEEATGALQELKDEHEVKTTELKAAKSDQNKLAKELQEAEKTLREMNSRVDKLKSTAATNRSKRDEATASNATNTSRNGRLGNLGTIPDEYDVAVTTAAGGLNNMVVDTVEQAQACIEHLRKYNVGRAQFYILEKLNVNSRNMERIQTPNNTPRLFDLITMKDKKFAPAFYMAMRDTLVAPDLDSGERIAFSGSGKRWRVVTMNGQLIDLSGTMSGGGTKVSRGGMSSKFAADSVSPDIIRRYEAESEKAEQEYSEALAQMRTFERGVEDMKRRAPSLNTAVSKLEMDIQGLEVRIKAAEKRLLNIQNDNKPNANDVKRIAALAKEISAIEGELNKLRAKAASYEKDIADLQEQILEVGGVKLRSQRSKVDDIKAMLELANDQQLKAETGRTKSEKDRKKYTAAIESNQTALEEIEEELTSLNENLQTCRADMQKLQQAVSQAEGAKDTYEDSLKELKEELDEKLKLTLSFRAKEQDFKQEIGEAEVELKSHKRKAQDFVQLHNKLELNDDIDEDEDEDEKEQPPVEEQGETAEDAMDEDGEKSVEPKVKDDPDAVPSKKPKREKHDPSELRIYTDEELASMNRDRLVADVTILEEKIGNAKPNLNVLPEYRRREAEYLAKAKEFEDITRQRDEQKAKYEELRKQRLDEFMTGFNMISSKLKEMYQMITLGGNAELDLVDTMDPFSEGVNFSVMPPKKSWKNISNLSGGEKVSLALVFALHVFKPTPLYFMDEIDAALDFRNVSIVANYIKDRTKDAQFIIISLRNDMFELSHRLVGIYKTNNATRSICIDNKPLLSAASSATQNGSIKA